MIEIELSEQVPLPKKLLQKIMGYFTDFPTDPMIMMTCRAFPAPL